MPPVPAKYLYGAVIQTTSDVCAPVERVDISYSFAGVVGTGVGFAVFDPENEGFFLGGVVLDPEVDPSYGTVSITVDPELSSGRLMIGMYVFDYGAPSFTELAITDVWVGPL